MVELLLIEIFSHILVLFQHGSELSVLEQFEMMQSMRVADIGGVRQCLDNLNWHTE